MFCECIWGRGAAPSPSTCFFFLRPTSSAGTSHPHLKRLQLKPWKKIIPKIKRNISQNVSPPTLFFSQGGERERERERETEREREKKLNSSQQFIILHVVRKVDHSLQLKPFFQMDTGGHMLPRVKLVRRNWPCCSSCLTRMSHRRTSALL